jgi:hypothetical protein
MSTYSKTSGAQSHLISILPKKKSRGLNKTTGSIFIDKPEVFEDIVADIPLTEKTRSVNYSYRTKRTSVTAEVSATDVQRQLLKDQLQIDAEKLERITKENIEKSIRKKVTKQDETFSRLVTDVDECRRSLDAIDKSLGLIEETKRNKLRRQFEDWNTQVHGTIQVAPTPL